MTSVFDDDVWRYAPLGPVPTVVIGATSLAVLVVLSLGAGPRSRLIARWLLGATTLGVLARSSYRWGG